MQESPSLILYVCILVISSWSLFFFYESTIIDLYGYIFTKEIKIFIVYIGVLYFAGIKAPSRDYDIPGSTASRVFTTIGAAANLVFAFNTGMLPEIQVGKINDLESLITFICLHLSCTTLATIETSVSLSFCLLKLCFYRLYGFRFSSDK